MVFDKILDINNVRTIPNIIIAITAKVGNIDALNHF